MDDQLVKGGVMDKGAFGLNWWVTRRWKIGFDCGLTALDKGGTQGLAISVHTRFPWVLPCELRF